MFVCFLFGGTEDMFPWSRCGKELKITKNRDLQGRMLCLNYKLHG